ncbi:ArsA family ATPase [Klenkia brasiliensis]|uniref:Arsenite-transporting ATPase n=1 Tax=Klenkia brasiliensis TaxID=333142 RepID=A0A1G7V528_9ACTN|nr:ArsA-related P-loop ATPase [Klenkia brasiliensis]SDG54912.1 arsenite-transporting ATPase [Klenkia brasiliensis]
MRTLLVTGPGGAGSSTVAAATALALAATGQRVVLLGASAPAIDGLADAVDVRVVQAGPALEAAWAGHADALAALVPVLTLPPASSTVPPPGAGQVALLTELGRAAGTADVVVVDAGPLPQALELLALPGATRWWLAQLAPPRLRVLASVRALTGKGRGGAVDAALAAVGALETALDRVPDRVEVHLVVAPDDRAVPAVRRAAAAAGLLGQPLGTVTLARVLPAGTGEWAEARAAAQDRVRAGLAGTGFAVRELAEAPVPPSDVAALGALGAAPADEVPEPVPVPTARREGAGWVLPVPLPGAGRGEVELTRWGDELVVGLAGLRRSLPLDALLRRCTVTGASVQHPGTPDAVLAVAFAPDPAQWPADLLAAEAAR